MKRTKWLIPVILLSGMLIALTACDLSDSIRRNLSAKAGPDTRVTLQAKGCSSDVDISLMNKTQQIVQQRLTGLGVSNAQVEVQDACHLVIDLTAPDNLEQLLDTVRQTGRLEFVDAGTEFFSTGTILRTTGNPSPTLTVSTTLATTIPDKVYSAIVSSADLLPDEFKVILGGVNSQQPEVAFKLEKTAAQRFKEFTSAHNETTLGEQYFLCIVLDNRVESCPSIRSPIPNSEGVITVGSGGIDEAQRLLNLLRFGSLPYELEVIQSVSK
jgi:preprotein translocase subunit SecD